MRSKPLATNYKRNREVKSALRRPVDSKSQCLELTKSKELSGKNVNLLVPGPSS